MPKLSEYVRMAADEYVREHGNIEPSARWVADFFLTSGVQDEYPRQDLGPSQRWCKRINQARGASGKNAPAARQDDPAAEVAAQILEPSFLRVQGQHNAGLRTIPDSECGVQRAQEPSWRERDATGTGANTTQYC